MSPCQRAAASQQSSCAKSKIAPAPYCSEFCTAVATSRTQRGSSWRYQADTHAAVSNPTQGDSRVGILLVVAIVMGYLYQGPPFRCALHP